MSDHKTCVLCAFFVVLVGALLPPPAAFGQEVTERRPNLQPFAAAEYAIVSDPVLGGTMLIFSTTSWNSGSGPVEIRGGEIDSSNTKQRVYQRVYLSDGGFYDRQAGWFEYHPSHGHIHFDDYALYTLRPVDPRYGPKTSAKTSFCLLDTTKVNTRLPGAPKQAVYTTCSATVQGISVGWADKYGRNLPGQSINITGYPPGDYDLIIEVDPKNNLLESSDGDNISCVRLHIDGLTVQTVGACTVAPPTGDVSITGIVPNSILAGHSDFVTITGSGFAEGMAVGFENGSGPAPTASNVQVSDDGTTITATVTVKSGGSGRGDNVWDLRVGPAVRPDAFTVIRP